MRDILWAFRYSRFLLHAPTPNKSLFVFVEIHAIDRTYFSYEIIAAQRTVAAE
jgi:hypothetical protein